MTWRTNEILREQRERFRQKFGREWRPNDPVFFDPDADEPTPISPVRMQTEVIEVLRQTGVAPQIIYAYRKTGLLVSESSKDHIPPDRRQEWDDAIDEYFAIDAAAQQESRPDPLPWKTEIPELLTSPFSQQDMDQVRECLRAIAPIEARGMKVVTRIELAAAFLASACNHAFDSADATRSGR